MSVEFLCDILVIGAGPAGSCAASTAARAGMSTVLIDAKVRIGEQPHCGEFVPERLFVEFDMDQSSVIHRVDSMETRTIEGVGQDSHKTKLVASPGFLIDRVRFDRDLAREAVAAGATVLCSTRLLRKENQDWFAGSGQEEMKFRPRFVIAADGALSTVARALGLKQASFLRGLQVEAPFCGVSDRTYIFLDRSIVGGYGWVFPKGKTANVGVGVDPRECPDTGRILAQFLSYLGGAGLIRPGQLARSGGVIPVSGVRDSLVVGNVVFCGDAAGLTHPITGAGIPQAVFSGRQAGQAVAEAIKSGSRQPLADYEAETKGRYGGIIDHALKKRRVMMDSWNEPDFDRVCERTWIAFKGYKTRERFQ
ncbi:MAG: NAD(P)/FAD-dependent oxidoreductase [Desulfomonile tiedjei]|nr:NAD(P)/FAD-dependent oxidoreductase [Desulfomonile tiedjei]